ncbi:hypothetical protein H072_9674 [Dactylellina haptotyla CBS 200.50]|uniref:Vacuolar ATPase assembly protein VMA22 n=1 Tax=Dactylellina haptotyla (strain CBS 200.50) TaxID=1284197 RepID=S8A198_DACHA|nr:hypothetical protein H072_9674 [Dactylellina haptotyla CBS 200.50]
MVTKEELLELQDHLDRIITSYLSLFDTYQSLQAEISSGLSKGYLSIAQANFSSGRFRYGQDYYDDRMTALRGVDITQTEDELAATQGLKTEYAVKELKTEEEQEYEVRIKTSGLRRRFVPPPSDDEMINGVTNEKKDKDSDDDVDNDPPFPFVKNRDPIRWFGLLTPSALKVAQTEFVDTLPRLLSVCGLLREIDRQEQEVRRVRQQVRGMRKELGIVTEDPLPAEEILQSP